MKKLILPLAVSVSMPALALPPIGEPGVGGVINVGYQFGQMESNFLAEINKFDVDLSAERVDDYGSPDGEDIDMPLAQVEVGWNFSNGKTRIALGNDFTDILELDRNTRLSLRHDFDGLGQFRLDYLHPTGFSTEVYRDPYQLGVSRATTEVETQGGRFVWDRMFGSGFGVSLLAKERDIDDEQSGFYENLTAAERGLLDRNGDELIAELSYQYKVDEWHSVRPAVSYVNYDLDGEAMAQEGFILSLEHYYLAERVEWGTKVAYTDLDGDERNPLFNDTHNADGFAVSTVVAFPKVIGKWAPSVQATYAALDSDIDFNDASIWSVGLGIGRKF